MNALLEPEQVLDQYGQLSTAIPVDVTLLGISIKNGVATADLSSEFESGGGSASAGYRLAQVVYTLTQFSTVRAVLFQVEGRTVTTFGPEGIVLDGLIAEGLRCAASIDLRGSTGVRCRANNPARITGNSNVFEATFRVALLDGSRKVLVDKMTMATCGSGCRGTFDVTLQYDVPKAQWGTLRVFRIRGRRQSRRHPRLSGLADPELDQVSGDALSGSVRALQSRAGAALAAPPGCLLSSAGSVQRAPRSGRGAAW